MLYLWGCIHSLCWYNWCPVPAETWWSHCQPPDLQSWEEGVGDRDDGISHWQLVVISSTPLFLGSHILLLWQWLVHWSLVTTLSADGSEGSLIHEGDAGATNTNLTISDTPWAGEFCFAYEGFTQLNHQASFSTIIIIILIHLLYHTTMARSRESVLPQSTMHFCVITMTHKWNSTSQHQPLHQNNYANLVCASALNLYLGLVVPL